MKVLFIYEFFTFGGVESVLRNRFLALKMLHPDIEVECLFLHQVAKAAPDFGDKVYFAHDPAEMRRIADRADVISVIDTPRVLKLCADTGKPLIVEVHSPYTEGRAYIKKPFPEETKLVVVPSHAFREVVVSEMPRKSARVEVLTNPLDPVFFDDSSCRGPSIDFRGAKPILWVGRLDELKDWRRALRIAAKLFESPAGRDLELFMVGHHSEAESAFDAFRRAGVLARLRYLPSIAFEEMPGLYRQVASAGGVYLSTSKGESFGMTLAEAMAAGLPAAVNALPAFREVSAGHAALFESDSEAVRQILSLVSEPELRSRMASEFREAVAAFRPENIGRRLYGLLSEAVA